MPYEDILLDNNYEHYTPDAMKGDVHVIRWRGPPQPREWAPREGQQWAVKGNDGQRGPMVPGLDWAPTYPSGRFLTLTAAFPHPPERGWDQ
eukprot:9444341-Heterocapsa_arctica.AAC.1